MSRIPKLLMLAILGCGSGTDVDGAPTVTTISSGGAGGEGAAGHGGAGAGGTGGEGGEGGEGGAAGGRGGDGGGGGGGGALAPVVLDCNAVTTPTGEEVLATGMTQPTGLVIRDGHVYFSQRGNEASAVPGALFRRPLSGGPCETLHLSHEALTLAPTGVDETHVYWASPHAIWRMPREGGPLELLVDRLDPTPRFVLDGLDLYFASYTGGNVARLDKTGGPVTILAQYQANPRLPTVDATWLYWPNQGGNIQGGASFQRVLKTGGPVEVFLPNRSIARRIDLMNGEIFVSDNAGLLRLPTVASPPQTLATDASFYAALDATHAYYSLCIQGRIQRVPLTGGPTVSFAIDQVCPAELASEPSHLYWLNQNSGQLVRKAK